MGGTGRIRQATSWLWTTPVRLPQPVDNVLPDPSPPTPSMLGAGDRPLHDLSGRQQLSRCCPTPAGHLLTGGSSQRGTIDTIFGSLTMTWATSRPSSARCTFGSPRAAAFASSSVMSVGTSIFARTLPCTCTTIVVCCSVRSAGSTVGQDALAIDGAWPSTSHISSATYGANRLSATAVNSAASRTAGSAGPQLVSIALRVALTSSIRRATTTLNRRESSRSVISPSILWVVRRTEVSPVAGSAPLSLVTSQATRYARCRNFSVAPGETSAQSMSSSGGPANTTVVRIASTPYRSICAPRSTPLPSDLDIALPLLMTWPWFMRRSNGSPKSTIPRSCSTFVKNREYSRCRIACSTPPTYWSTGIHFATSALSNGPPV